MEKKVELYVPLEVWSDIMVRLDKRVELIAEKYGYGKVNLAITINQGRVTDIIFGDEGKVRALAETIAKAHKK